MSESKWGVRRNSDGAWYSGSNGGWSGESSRYELTRKAALAYGSTCTPGTATIVELPAPVTKTSEDWIKVGQRVRNVGTGTLGVVCDVSPDGWIRLQLDDGGVRSLESKAMQLCYAPVYHEHPLDWKVGQQVVFSYDLRRATIREVDLTHGATGIVRGVFDDGSTWSATGDTMRTDAAMVDDEPASSWPPWATEGQPVLHSDGTEGRVSRVEVFEGQKSACVEWPRADIWYTADELLQYVKPLEGVRRTGPVSMSIEPSPVMWRGIQAPKPRLYVTTMKAADVPAPAKSSSDLRSANRAHAVHRAKACPADLPPRQWAAAVAAVEEHASAQAEPVDVAPLLAALEIGMRAGRRAR